MLRNPKVAIALAIISVISAILVLISIVMYTGV